MVKVYYARECPLAGSCSVKVADRIDNRSRMAKAGSAGDPASRTMVDEEDADRLCDNRSSMVKAGSAGDDAFPSEVDMYALRAYIESAGFVAMARSKANRGLAGQAVVRKLAVGGMGIMSLKVRKPKPSRTVSL